MAQNIFLTCEFTRNELFTIIFKSMDWFFRFEKLNKENEYFGSLIEIINEIEKHNPSRNPKIYIIRIGGNPWTKELYFYCPVTSTWRSIADTREFYGLKRKYISAVGGDIQTTPRA